MVFLWLMVIVLIFSPWADAPSPNSDKSQPVAATMTLEEPATTEASEARLRVAAALEPDAFELLQTHNDDFRIGHPDIEVELVRVEPATAYAEFRQAARLEELADIILLPSEWVLEFAASGYLLPADAAFAAKGLAEQFNALTGFARWNSYLWAVPRDMDPYVTVWNTDVLNEWFGEEANIPDNYEQWTQLATRRGELEEQAPSWVALDGYDPHAMLAWLENVAGKRSDGIWSEGGRPWEDEELNQALTLLDQSRASALFARSSAEAANAVREGRSAVALLPYSVAAGMLDSAGASQAEQLVLDRRTWDLPSVWPRGSSFAISSLTRAADAAYTWIASMSDETVQRQNRLKFDKLPVYRSMYKSDPSLSSLIREAAADAYPNVLPRGGGPALPARLKRLGELWTAFAAGQFAAPDWEARWVPNSASGGQAQDEASPAAGEGASDKSPTPAEGQASDEAQATTDASENQASPDEPTAAADGETPEEPDSTADQPSSEQQPSTGNQSTPTEESGGTDDGTAPVSTNEPSPTEESVPTGG